MSVDRLEITVHFKDGEFPRELVLNRAGREVDHVDMDGRRLEDVLRCADCMHFEPTAKNGICHRSEFLPMWAEPDGFCSWAERRSE